MRETAERVIQQAADAIAGADAILIGAGAGMGVDSGLPDFQGYQGFWRAYPPYARLRLFFTALANPRLVSRRPGARLRILRSSPGPLPTHPRPPDCEPRDFTCLLFVKGCEAARSAGQVPRCSHGILKARVSAINWPSHSRKGVPPVPLGSSTQRASTRVRSPGGPRGRSPPPPAPR